jgi:hypothetical protein
MILKLEAVQVDPSNYNEIIEFTKDPISCHFVYAALKYYKEGRLEAINLTVFQVLHAEKRLYCALHEFAQER